MIKCITELLPNKNTPIYVGVSMGIDSIAAYFYLRSKGYNVIPLHFNHGLRDQNNEMENKFRELFNLPSGYFSDHVKKMGIVGHGNNLTSENDCRHARIEFFKKHAEGSILVTGHHLDDYVESYLLNCFRGQPEYRPFKLVSDFVSFKIVHPFLLTEKNDILNILGFILYATIFVSWILVLKSDANKLMENSNTDKK